MGFNDELNKITDNLLGVFFQEMPLLRQADGENAAVRNLRGRAAPVRGDPPGRGLRPLHRAALL